MVKEIKFAGMVAFPGEVSGRAFLVKNDRDVKDFEEGRILIAVATYPEYIHAMLKAKAIVTETGGLLSHSAIVSREFKIPCVVGVDGIMNKAKNNDLIMIKNGGIVVRRE